MNEEPRLDLSLPYITEGLDGIGGVIKKKPEHFVVEEILSYEPSGVGDHLYVSVTKTNLNTRDVQLGLAKLFQARPEGIGKAGLKDRHSVSTQTFSILFDGEKPDPSDASSLIEEFIGVRVNSARYHTNKLRSGHLRGNRFTITVTDLEVEVDEAVSRAEAIRSELQRTGVPNFYGSQRTGEEGDNTISGWMLLQGRKRIRDRWLRRYLVSCYQSYLCNRYLTLRVEKGLFGRVLVGDIAQKYDTGGMFWVEDAEAEQRRYRDKEITFTAPMFGYKMKQPKLEAMELEREVIEEAGVTDEQYRALKAKGTRRLGRLLPEVAVFVCDEGLRLCFMLSKGGFATTVLREFMKADDQIKLNESND
ncbi:tRNA pseudouridine(13) synthase TruD [Candidatus Bathyarchaeota archaeon]|nr:tRNA pseudouridine(13) synthase TruD [Candidatus Bathyarchaeota archaeon]